VTGADVALDDDAAHGRVERQVLFHLAGSFDPVDLSLGNVPEFQPSPRSRYHFGGALNGIDVVAGNGAITLFGTAETRMKREIAGKVAAGVAGVKSVENKLAIVAGS